MNEFIELFGSRITNFRNDSFGLDKPKLLEDILNYANANPQKFRNELKEIQFDKEIDTLPVVLEALSKDTDKWGELYVEQLDEF